MAREDLIETEGTVTEVFPSGNFQVTLENGSKVLAHLSGKLRENRIRVVLGDSVVVGITPYDLGRGRIVYRNK